MAKGKYWALYQDHACSAALRVGRELFALLPVDTVVVNLARVGLDESTGKVGPQTILSVSFDRAAFVDLAFARVDPSEAVTRYKPRMKFKKTTGFSAVETDRRRRDGHRDGAMRTSGA